MVKEDEDEEEKFRKTKKIKQYNLVSGNRQ